jgi:hypothetical protein
MFNSNGLCGSLKIGVKGMECLNSEKREFEALYFFLIKGGSTAISFKKKKQFYITSRNEHHHNNAPNITLHHLILGGKPEKRHQELRR